MYFNVVFSYSNLNMIFFFKQNYSKLHLVEVIVKASLNIDSRAKNIVLKNAEFPVLFIDLNILFCHSNIEPKQMSETVKLMLCLCPLFPAETDGVPREA